MGLEAIMICLDNSEAMRSGDYSPSRMEAMTDAVNQIVDIKINNNAETTVGVLSMAGSRVEVHVSPCRNLGQIMTSIQKEVKIGGESNFLGGLKVAQLALKNRPNKNQRQRIIMFVGSPVNDDVKELTKLAKQFKKNNVAVDIVNFGTENCLGHDTQNPEKLEEFIKAVNSSDNSHLVSIPPGPHIFSDMLVETAILSEAGGAVGGAAGAGAGGAGAGLGAGGAGGNVDPNLDPELAMALRISREEERARQEQAVKAATAASTASSSAAGSSSAAAAGTGAAPMQIDSSGGAEVDDEEALLQKAIELSMAAQGGDVDMTPLKPAGSAAGAAPAASSSSSSAAAASTPAGAGGAGAGAGAGDNDDLAAVIQDRDFIAQLLETIPGGSPDSIDVDDILKQLTNEDADKDKDKSKDKDNKDGGKKS